MNTIQAFQIFEKSIAKYHVLDSVDQAFENPFEPNSLDHLLYRKSWIDTVQWHYEAVSYTHLTLPTMDSV